MIKNLEVEDGYWRIIKNRIKLPSAHGWVRTFPTNIPHTLVTGDRHLNFRFQVCSFLKKELRGLI
jgi:hypothetical protein